MLITAIVPSLILLAGVVDDLRSRKVHNWLVGVLFVVAAVSQFYFQDWFGLQQGLFGCVTALVVTLPLVLTRALGAGDMKLMLAFGMATNWTVTLSVLFWALIWGALLGVIRAIVAGEFNKLLFSTYEVALRRRPPEASLHKIPYTVALFFGWLCYLTLARLPGGWP